MQPYLVAGALSVYIRLSVRLSLCPVPPIWSKLESRVKLKFNGMISWSTLSRVCGGAIMR